MASVAFKPANVHGSIHGASHGRHRAPSRPETAEPEPATFADLLDAAAGDHPDPTSQPAQPNSADRTAVQTTTAADPANLAQTPPASRAPVAVLPVVALPTVDGGNAVPLVLPPAAAIVPTEAASIKAGPGANKPVAATASPETTSATSTTGQATTDPAPAAAVGPIAAVVVIPTQPNAAPNPSTVDDSTQIGPVAGQSTSHSKTAVPKVATTNQAPTAPAAAEPTPDRLPPTDATEGDNAALVNATDNQPADRLHRAPNTAVPDITPASTAAASTAARAASANARVANTTAVKAAPTNATTDTAATSAVPTNTTAAGTAATKAAPADTTATDAAAAEAAPANTTAADTTAADKTTAIMAPVNAAPVNAAPANGTSENPAAENPAPPSAPPANSINAATTAAPNTSVSMPSAAEPAAIPADNPSSSAPPANSADAATAAPTPSVQAEAVTSSPTPDATTPRTDVPVAATIDQPRQTMTAARILGRILGRAETTSGKSEKIDTAALRPARLDRPMTDAKIRPKRRKRRRPYRLTPLRSRQLRTASQAMRRRANPPPLMSGKSLPRKARHPSYKRRLQPMGRQRAMRKPLEPSPPHPRRARRRCRSRSQPRPDPFRSPALPSKSSPTPRLAIATSTSDSIRRNSAASTSGSTSTATAA